MADLEFHKGLTTADVEAGRQSVRWEGIFKIEATVNLGSPLDPAVKMINVTVVDKN